MGRTGFTLLILGSAALLKPTHLVRVWVGPVLLYWPELLASGETPFSFTGDSTGFPAAPAALAHSF